MRAWPHSGLRKLVPAKVKRMIRGTIQRNRWWMKHESTFVNIYHCCVQKTGSQWVKAMLSDWETYRYSGLTVFNYRKSRPGGGYARKITDMGFTEPFPGDTIVTPLYTDFGNYSAIPKPERYRVFFVMRDPRDLVVSWYFSVRYSHALMGRVPEHREVLNRLSVADGMLYSIEYLHDYGLFVALESWIDAPKRDPNVLLLRFEDMTARDNLGVFEELLLHCDIHMPEKALSALLQNYSFERLAGRKRGKEDRTSHYRRGIPGDWKNYFNSMIMARFEEVTGDLAVRLGYEKPDR